jgi:hypothetical protein
VADIAKEAKVHYTNLDHFTINRSIIANLKDNRQDTLLLAVAKFNKVPSTQEKDRFLSWLKLRTKADTISLIIQ